MSVGIVLSCFNHFYFRRYVSVFNEFIPQMIFLQVRCGWWCPTDQSAQPVPLQNPSNDPVR